MLCSLRDRVTGEVAKGVLRAQLQNPSTYSSRTTFTSSENAVVLDSEPVKVGEFGKFNLKVERPDHGEIK